MIKKCQKRVSVTFSVGSCFSTRNLHEVHTESAFLNFKCNPWPICQGNFNKLLQVSGNRVTLPCLRFGQVWELTEYSGRKPRMKPLALSFYINNKQTLHRHRTEHWLRIFFGGNDKTPSFMVPRTEQVFLIVPVHSTLVRKDGVSPISCCD